MLVTPDNRFITARDFPALTQVTTELHDQALLLQAPGMTPLTLESALKSALESDRDASRLPGPELTVEIWGQRVSALSGGPQADDWFSAYLNQDCRLVFMAEDQHRPVDPSYARDSDEVSFADGFPVLMISEASLDDLNSRLDNPVSMRRFRPNLVISTREPFAEDRWHSVRIGETEFECAKACPRCILTTIDPDTAEVDARQEPLRTLGSYRRDPSGGVNFGQNLIPRKLGRVRVGDTVLPIA